MTESELKSELNQIKNLIKPNGKRDIFWRITSIFGVSLVTAVITLTLFVSEVNHRFDTIEMNQLKIDLNQSEIKNNRTVNDLQIIQMDILIKTMNEVMPEKKINEEIGERTKRYFDYRTRGTSN
jgi:hypothetical protein